MCMHVVPSHTTPRRVRAQVPIWNPTVANLTLLALGSSAPEIILSIIDTVSRLGKTGRVLGSATILGSAAFNLLIIPCVCTLSLPSGESRRISQYGVFICTAFFALWAYLWVYICLEAWTPGARTTDALRLTSGVVELGIHCMWPVSSAQIERLIAACAPDLRRGPCVCVLLT